MIVHQCRISGFLISVQLLFWNIKNLLHSVNLQLTFVLLMPNTQGQLKNELLVTH